MKRPSLRHLVFLSSVGLASCAAPTPSPPPTTAPFARWIQVPTAEPSQAHFVRCVEPLCPARTPKTEATEPALQESHARPGARAPP